jgi:hypothetical protein
MDRVFRPKFFSVFELGAQINNEVTSETSQVLGNTWHELERRLDIRRATNGSHIEIR